MDTMERSSAKEVPDNLKRAVAPQCGVHATWPVQAVIYSTELWIRKWTFTLELYYCSFKPTFLHYQKRSFMVSLSLYDTVPIWKLLNKLTDFH
jgi:hypothetical protein